MKIADLLPQYTAENQHLKNVVVNGVGIDSRHLAPGALFVAIEGDRVDGHDFIEQAIANGAGAVMVSRPVRASVPVIVVPNTRLALQQMAAYYRNQWNIPMVAVTGSCGKTTTKNILAQILSAHQSTLSTKGNLNNLFGLPLTLFQLQSQHACGVFELGASCRGEIARLAEILCPDIAIITNAGASHLAHMGGSVRAIAEEKGALFSALPSDGLAVINVEDAHAAYWVSILGARDWVGFTVSGYTHPDINMQQCKAIYRATQVVTLPEGHRFTVQSANSAFTVVMPLAGQHNIANALAAIAVAQYLGVPTEVISEALAATQAEPGRLQTYHGKGRALIDDSYNANPQSFLAAIEVLANCEPGQKVLVMGDMAELDEAGVTYHQDIGKAARAQGIDQLFCFGELSRHAAEAFGDQAQYFACKDALLAALSQALPQQWCVLVKGSRSTGMEYVTQQLKGWL